MTTNKDPMRAVVPEHECDGSGDCGYAPAMSLSAIEADDGSIDTFVTIHLVSIDSVLKATITMLDDALMKNLPEEVPAVIRYARARDAIRHAVAVLPPPPDVASDLDTLMESMKGGDDDGGL
jgi:hypothetical protein